ncbi:hypothetical protein TrLO_g12728 [Triparma laevis f. longispina]|uniref:Uncharacterized protein n=1 Tax=Triparma laevis f. longispina TaxID=1714387 RepID=A0A9W6ZF22_9STRA|nr:hypothetical protein TrLO_g12728 [Triparma laevis f. longispina]
MKSDQMLKINIMVEDIASLKKQVAEQGVATTEQGVANATQNEEIIAALKSKATADQTTKIASLEAELKIARLELRAENAEKENAELRAEEEIASLKQQLASTTDSKKRKHA